MTKTRKMSVQGGKSLRARRKNIDISNNIGINSAAMRQYFHHLDTLAYRERIAKRTK